MLTDRILCERARVPIFLSFVNISKFTIPLKLFDEISSSEIFTTLEIDSGIQPFSLLLSNVRNCNELPNWNSQKLPVSFVRLGKSDTGIGPAKLQFYEIQKISKSYA